ncbi:P-loop containing nucleoside triphosphate hydrolase protein [Rhizoclosmatium globosum]|uniref:p-loop containing nucleoside triphosphate hydrolase protein n=1 Tax=Rhizoclosmatium globosum TaxID=329046 RepID=A0A1Y2CE85_9FUNG|nr:P-loop containing nucleoside triphosphate hydrolase protein [Rhizoclosmatium globosum]|eukprot:ORY45332.1 P-loop containing nucleoside triphosphate hydrolase protein [Rhizoclosmatium globosum]
MSNNQPPPKKATSTENQPWIEKYRPRETVNVLKKTLESVSFANQSPHADTLNQTGTGKTSTILALARDIYGPEAMKTRVLELNASDERGIDIVREKVKNFARVTVSSGVSSDEADSMTMDAQSALRRTMETYSKMTRFCLICNYVSRIIEPLASRCSKFRFKPLDNTSIKSRLMEIAELSDLQTIDMLITVSEGDLRKAIMYLQSAYRLHQDEVIQPDAIVEIAGVVPFRVKDFYVIQQAVQRVTREGYSGTQVVSQLHDRMLSDVELTCAQKARMSESFGAIDKALVDGSDEQMQLLKLLIS